MFDESLIRYHYTSGHGVGTEEYDFVTDPDRIRPIIDMFDAVWERGIPHTDYHPI